MLSVIVPIYNAGQFLTRCIDSILAQNFSWFECILVDDGSTDRSPDICQEYQSTDHRVRFFHKRNGGISSARNAGLEVARGKWITFIDADDVLPTTAFSDLLSRASDSDLIVGGVEYLMSGVQYIPSDCRIQKGDHSLEYEIMRPYFVTAWGKLFKRDLLGTLRFNERCLCSEDVSFVWRYVSMVETITLVKGVVYFYKDDSPESKYSLSCEQYKFHVGLCLAALSNCQIWHNLQFLSAEQYVYKYHTARLLYSLLQCDSYEGFRSEIKAIQSEKIIIDSVKKNLFYKFCKSSPRLAYFLCSHSRF